MTVHEIQTGVNLPEFGQQLSVDELDLAIDQYPYAGTLFVLKAIKLHDLQDIQFLETLTKAAARTISRAHLKKLIEGPVELIFEWSPALEVEPVHSGSVALESGDENQDNRDLPFDFQTDSIFTEVDSEVEIVEDTPLETHEVEEQIEIPKINSFGFSFVKVKGAKKQVVSREPFDIQKINSIGSTRSRKNQDGLIEKFLEQMPSISSPRIDFGENSSQPDLSVPSTSLNEDIVTENMALIYLKQKNFEKALEIYRRLKLKFPEKSAFFAALIKNIENTTV